MSAAAHLLLVALWRVEGRLPDVVRQPAIQMVTLPPPELQSAPELPELPQEPVRARRQPQPRAVPRPSRPGPAPAPAPAPAPPPQPPAQPAPADTGAAPAASARIGPSLAQGRLWVRPLPLPPRELAQRVTRSHTELVDSAVTATVQAYLDSIAADPTLRNAELPSWTTEIEGKTFGIDSRNIYIAGLKIPAAVLALLPVPASGNPDQRRAYQHLQDMRADIQRAAMRAQNAQEFKEMIRDMRERKEREREFERNQRTPPPRIPAPADTIRAEP